MAGSLRALLLLAGLAPLAGARPAEPIHWEPDADAAFARAVREGKPLLVAFNMDGEVANDEAVRLHYRDPEIVGLSRRFVCLVGSIGDHADDPEAICPRFGSIPCGRHREVERSIRRRFIEGDLVEAPQHVLCEPSGEEMFRKAFRMSVADLHRAMAVALLRSKPGPEALRDCLAALRDRSESVRACGLVAAFGLEPHADLAKALRGLAGSRDGEIRALALWALAGQRDPANQAAFDRVARAERSSGVRDLAASAALYNAGAEVPGYRNLFGSFFWDRGESLPASGSVFY